MNVVIFVPLYSIYYKTLRLVRYTKFINRVRTKHFHSEKKIELLVLQSLHNCGMSVCVSVITNSLDFY